MNNGCNVGKTFHVVNQGRTFPQPCLCRIRRAGTGIATSTFDRQNQGGFFTADKGSGSNANLHFEVEAGIEDLATQQAIFFRLLDGFL